MDFTGSDIFFRRCAYRNDISSLSLYLIRYNTNYEPAIPIEG